MRKPALIITGVVLGLFIMAGVLWIPGYDRAGVHPKLLAFEEPIQQAWADNFPTGDLGVTIRDARSRYVPFYLKAEQEGESVFYPEFMIDGTSVGEGVNYPLSKDSRMFLAGLIDKYAKQGQDRHDGLERLRDAPLDTLRRWWFRLDLRR